MRSRDLALVLVVTIGWGVNFTVVDLALNQLPPLLFVALRFVLVAVPAIFFVPRPDISWGWITAIGLLLGVGDFGLLFIGINQGMPAGLSSLLMQSQAVFTLALAAVFLGERATVRSLAGLAVAIAGIGVIATGRRTGVPLDAFLLVLAAAICWGAANVCTRKAQPSSGMRLMVWASVVPPVPLIAMSLALNGPQAARQVMTGFGLGEAGALVYVVAVSTFFGFGIWYSLLRRYPASTVAPFSLLVPAFGITAAWIVLGERPAAAEWAGIVLVLVGLAALSLPTRRRDVTRLRQDLTAQE